ncbi:MAG: hypothetical protein IAG13_05755 [Deltaproteobacteria bacterium]|nr:hypothetical protein [Nannocystaceae bacterium]
MTTEQDTKAGERTKRRLETIAGTLGALLTAGTLAVLVYDGIAGDGGPPAIVVESGAARVVDDKYVIDITVRNDGDQTAAAVVIEGALRRGDTIVETRELELDYVSPRTVHTGGLVFTHDPALHELELHAKSWTTP